MFIIVINIVQNLLHMILNLLFIYLIMLKFILVQLLLFVRNFVITLICRTTLLIIQLMASNHNFSKVYGLLFYILGFLRNLIKLTKFCIFFRLYGILRGYVIILRIKNVGLNVFSKHLYKTEEYNLIFNYSYKILFLYIDF